MNVLRGTHCCTYLQVKTETWRTIKGLQAVSNSSTGSCCYTWKHCRDNDTLFCFVFLSTNNYCLILFKFLQKSRGALLIALCCAGPDSFLLELYDGRNEHNLQLYLSQVFATRVSSKIRLGDRGSCGECLLNFALRKRKLWRAQGPPLRTKHCCRERYMKNQAVKNSNQDRSCDLWPERKNETL